jgi:WXG100 family type VII secretion target
MADLKYDTETMRITATNYRTIATTMSSLQKTLKKQIADLKAVYWKSDAGTAFQDMYEDGWADNVDKYVAVLNEMARQLDAAANEYDKVTAKLKEIEGVSI